MVEDVEPLHGRDSLIVAFGTAVCMGMVHTSEKCSNYHDMKHSLEQLRSELGSFIRDYSPRDSVL